MDNYELAHAAASRAVAALRALGVSPADIADGLLTAGLAIWAADVDRLPAARELLRAWTEVRDGR